MAETGRDPYRVGVQPQKGESVKPYYQDEWATIYHGDCREVLPLLPKVDLVLTDPPYGVGYDYGDEISDDPEKHWPWMLDALRLMREVAPTVFTHRQKAVWHLPEPTHLGIWHKTLALGYAISGWLAHWEPVFVYGAEVGRTDNGRKAASFDVWSMPCVPNKHGHPAEKPIRLYKALLQTFPQYEIICDPFMGSGTTLRAAKDLGRKSIGVEIEEKYCEIAVKRLQQEVFDFSQTKGKA